nr:hypothetical protein CFP56_58442 [Quercus suber]
MPEKLREPRNLKKSSSTPRPSEEEDIGAPRRDHAERSHPPPLITVQSDPLPEPRNPDLNDLISTPFHHHHSTASPIDIPI